MHWPMVVDAAYLRIVINEGSNRIIEHDYTAQFNWCVLCTKYNKYGNKFHKIIALIVIKYNTIIILDF